MAYIYRSKTILFLSTLLFFNQVQAANNNSFPTEYGASIAGLYSSKSIATFDLLLPITGQAEQFLFIDPQGLFHSSEEYSGSFGAGYRSLTKAGILSGYIFADYNQAQGENFWFLSPGIQRLGEAVDFAANLYIPISSQRIDTGVQFVDELGSDEFVSFQGHQQVDQLANTFVSTGTGFDAELGYRLPFFANNIRIYGGGYYFQPKDNEHIAGAESRLNIPMNKYINLTASEAYDNVAHNTAKIGLTLTLGGRENTRHNDLSQRIVDPLSRNLIAITGSSTTNQPVSQGYELSNEFAVEQTNIWFFTSTANPETEITSNSCTADNPCALTQENIDDINAIAPYANLYVASGTYTNLNTDTDGQLTLSSGQSMFGRSTGFIRAASYNSMPVLFGALQLPGNNYLELIKLLNNSSQSTGILIADNAHNIILNTLIIGNNGINPNQAYSTGIQLGSNDSVTIVDSEIYAFSNSAIFPDIIAGIKLSNVSDDQLLVISSTISATTTFPDPGQAPASYAVFVGAENNSSGITVENNQLWLKNDSILSSSTYASFGVFLGSFNSEMSTVENNSISIDYSDIHASNGSSIGVFLGNFFGPGFNQVQENTVDIYKTTIESQTGATNAYGIFLGNYQANNSVMNNQINVDSTSIDAAGAAIAGSETFGIFFGNFLDTNSDANVSQNSFSLSNSQINAQSLGSAMSPATGILLGSSDSFGPVQSQKNTLNIYQITINATSQGTGSFADGIAISGFENQITVQDSSVLASTAGTMSLAMGVEAFQANNIVLRNDNFTISSAASSGAAFVDSGLNTWSIDAATLSHTSVNTANQGCVTVNIPFGSGCLN